jgi:hypothetical protein
MSKEKSALSWRDMFGTRKSFVRLHDSAIVNLANYIKTEKQEQQ